MKKTKIVAAYLPQYHETPDNNLFWGEGFTDWKAVKDAKPQYPGHRQPKRPLNENYYDLSDENIIRWQAGLAREYGIDAFNIYHYWFKDGKQELEKPAELLLANPDIQIEYFFSWDNSAWIRSWSNVPGGNAWAPSYDRKTQGGKQVLVELDYGDESQWRNHFEYLLAFFKDDRYLKIDGKPVFCFMRSGDGEILTKIRDCWQRLAKENGFPGLYLISSKRSFLEPYYFDNVYLYEPNASGWGKRIAIEVRLKKLFRFPEKKSKTIRLDYDRYWKKLLKNAKRIKREFFLGALVSFDDTPRRGGQARIIENSTPLRFKQYFRDLYRMSCERNNELVFLTAWNEWGEGACLEPDEDNGYGYLDAVKEVKRDVLASLAETGGL